MGEQEKGQEEAEEGGGRRILRSMGPHRLGGNRVVQ